MASLVEACMQARDGQALADGDVAAGRAAPPPEKEIAAMQQVERAQGSRVALNVGGVRYETSIATLRSVPNTMLDAMFSGRYAMEPDDGAGAHFLDRDGLLFRYVLEYLRDGVSVLEEAAGDVRLLRALKREFGYFAIELEPQQQPSSRAVYAVGGTNMFGYLSSMEKYDPATGTWTPVAPMLAAKNSLYACAVGGRVFVFGGIEIRDGTTHVSSETHRYDPATDAWVSVAPMPAARDGLCACAVRDFVYVMGGWLEMSVVRKTCWRYDVAGDVWSVMQSMPDARTYFAACVLDGDIYVLGGKDTFGSVCDSVFRYSTDADEWTRLAPMPEPVCCFAAVVMGGALYAVGGSGPGAGAPTSTMHKYTPATDSWEEVAPMPTARAELGATVLGGFLYAAGGWLSTWTTTAAVERYDPSTDSWTGMQPMGNARRLLGMCSVVREGEEVDLFDAMIARAS